MPTSSWSIRVLGGKLHNDNVYLQLLDVHIWGGFGAKFGGISNHERAMQFLLPLSEHTGLQAAANFIYFFFWSFSEVNTEAQAYGLAFKILEETSTIFMNWVHHKMNSFISTL